MRRGIILFYLSVFLTGAIYSVQDKIKIQRIDTKEYPFVRVEVSVSQITPVLNLEESNFVLHENDWKIGYFKIKKDSEEKSKKYINLLVNASSDISEAEFEEQLKAVTEFVQKMNPSNKMAVTVFDSLYFNMCHFTANKKLLFNCIQQIKQKDKMPRLFDNIIDAVYASAKENPSSSSLIVFTNGNNEKSTMKLDDAISLSQKQNTAVYIISASENETVKPLNRLSRLSGGQMYSAKPEDLTNIYLLIGALIDNTYLIEYRSQAVETTKNNDLVELKVVLKRNGTESEDSSRFYISDNFAFELWQKFIHNKKLVYYSLAFMVLFLIILFGRHMAKRAPAFETHDEFDEFLPNEFIESTGFAEPVNFTPVYASRPKSTAAQTKQRPALKKITVLRFAYLVEKEGPNVGKKYGLVWEEATIGSRTDNTIVIMDPAVSLVHAKIKKKKMKFILYDLISDTGTYLNGKKLLRPKELQDFDEIKMGYTRLIFRKVYK